MVGIPQLLGFLGEAGSRIFKWKDRKRKRARDDLGKEVLTGNDSNKLTRKWRRLFKK